MTTITLKGAKVHTVGELPAVGMRAPDVTLTKMDMSDIKLHDYSGKKIIMNIFPSLDTAVCASAMGQFEKMATANPNVVILCISADLPFAQKRFCTAQHVSNVQPVSIFRHPEFGDTYGVTIADGPLAGLLSRAVIIVDENGLISYTKQINELTDEPDYAEITAALAK